MLERRPAAASDEPLLRRLYATTHADVAEWPEEERSVFLDLQFRAQQKEWQRRFSGSHHEVILLDGQPIGRLWVDWSQDRCLLVDLTLLPEHRRSGIGRRLIGETLATAGRRGVPARVTVERTNESSLAFCARLGFEVVAEGPVYLELERAPVSEEPRLRGSA